MIYIFMHKGHWPVGACSVITAVTEQVAREKIAILLHKQGLIDAQPRLVWKSGDVDTMILSGDY